MVTKTEAYQQAFGIQPRKASRRRHAWTQALDIRKFEIGLYWQRASYFWALIAVAFGGYFAVLAADSMPDKEFNAFVIASIGFVFSFAWFLVNRGSKFWQENWENHVDMLEDEIAGPLYKTVLRRARPDNLIERWVYGPLPISVSKLNQWVSLFTLLIWPVLAFNVLPPFSVDGRISIKHSVIVVFVVFVSVLMLIKSKTNLGKPNEVVVVTRTVGIRDSQPPVP